MIDVVIVSNAIDSSKADMTMQAARTALRDQQVDGVVIVEQQTHRQYDGHGITTIHYDFPFNYHRCLNYGVQYTDAPYIALCNNDLVFSDDWANRLLHGMNGHLSASPWSDNVHNMLWGNINFNPVGWDVRSIVCGWCIVIHESVLDRIGGLHEGVTFWYSDNLYAEQIKKAGIKHILVRGSKVKHLETQTLNGHPLLNEYTGGQFEAYQNALNEINNI